MIAPLRRAHRMVWAVLALALPLLLAAGLMVRRDTTTVNRELRLP